MGWMIRLALAGAGAAMLGGCATGGASTGATEPVGLHNLQYIGTHNSYHIAPDAAVFALMRATDYAESPEWPAAALIPALSFTHPPLTAQLDAGLRFFELDVHDDPEGGRFANPGAFTALSPEARATLPPFDPAGELAAPGLKVFHTADTDVRSQCLLFRQCLEEIRAWSAAHPGHLPIIVAIESKEGRKPPLADAYEPAQPAPFEADAFGRLHAEIRGVFPPEAILTPAEVMGDHASLNAAARARGWPDVETLRGRVLFLLLDEPGKQDLYVDAFAAAPGGLLLFPSRSPADPHTAWLIRPKPNVQRLRALVRDGFLVYTRADAGGVEARAFDTRRAEAAFASGAQLIATDFPKPDPSIGDYAVSFGGAYIRCNPARPTPDCTALQRIAPASSAK